MNRVTSTRSRRESVRTISVYSFLFLFLLVLSALIIWVLRVEVAGHIVRLDISM